MPRETGNSVSRTEERARAWADLGRFSTQAIGGAMGCAVHGSIVRQYVRNYLREHGRFPIGLHKVSGRYARQTIRFETVFPGRGAAALAASGQTPGREDVWGPYPADRKRAFGRARREYKTSPDRPRLRTWLLGQIEDALRNQLAGGEQ